MHLTFLLRKCITEAMIRSSGPEVFWNTRVGVSLLIKLPLAGNLLKKILWHMCFPVNFVKFFKNIFFKRTFPVTSGPWQSWPRLTFNVLKIIEMQPTASTSCHLKHLFPQISTGVLKQTIKTIKMFNWTNKKI